MTQGKPLVLELPLPVVDVGHAHAVFDDQFSHANAAALSFPETHWRQLEGPFLAGEPCTSTYSKGQWTPPSRTCLLALQANVAVSDLGKIMKFKVSVVA